MIRGEGCFSGTGTCAELEATLVKECGSTSDITGGIKLGYLDFAIKFHRTTSDESCFTPLYKVLLRAVSDPMPSVVLLKLNSGTESSTSAIFVSKDYGDQWSGIFRTSGDVRSEWTTLEIQQLTPGNSVEIRKVEVYQGYQEPFKVFENACFDTEGSCANFETTYESECPGDSAGGIKLTERFDTLIIKESDKSESCTTTP